MLLTGMTLFSKSMVLDIQRFGRQEKCEIVNNLWPHLKLSPDDFIEDDYLTFFQYMGKTLQDLHSHELGFAAQGFEGLLGIVGKLRENRTLTRDTIAAKVKQDYLNTSDAAVSRSMELAIRLWLCINVHSRALIVGPRNPRDTRIEWKMDETLDQMLAAQFTEEKNKAAATVFQLDDSFTAANLKRVCRLHIRWTNNLKDHLRLEGQKGRRSLSIYQQKTCLINHYRDEDPIIPKEVLDEAIRTLDILFPLGDLMTEKFLRQGAISIYAPSEIPRSYELEDFKYWKSNLIQLLELLNGPPESVIQTLLDTRNLAQWAALWIAIFGIFILTMIFGILATVYGIKQYRLAIDSYEISVKSYQLALALACQQTAPPLAGFCD